MLNQQARIGQSSADVSTGMNAEAELCICQVYARAWLARLDHLVCQCYILLYFDVFSCHGHVMRV